MGVKRKALSRRVLHVASALLLVLAGMEITAQFLRPMLRLRVPSFYYLPYMKELHERDERLVWRLKAGAQAEIKNSEGRRIHYEINPFGYRSGNSMQSTQVPLFALGDSFTFGTGVEEDEAYPARLQRRISRPVWNFGVMGYAPDQYLLLWREWSVRMKPAAVIVQLSNNDIQDMYEHAWHEANGELISGADKVPVYLSDSVRREGFDSPFQLVNLLRYFRLLMARSAPDPAKVELGMKRMAFILDRLAFELKEAGVPMVILQASDFGAPVYGLEEAQKFEHVVKGVAERYGAALVTPHTQFHAEDFLPFPDLHWRPETQEKVAQMLEKRILSLLPKEKKR